MIEITPEIMGPGIEEEYADALAAIADLRKALGARPLTNDTPDGRALLEAAWLEQEIRRRRLPIPVDASYAGTIYYLAGSGELLGAPGLIDKAGVEDAIHRLYIVLKGYGLIKRRHVPVLIAMIDDLYSDARNVWDRLTPGEKHAMDDLHAQAETMRSGDWPAQRPPEVRFLAADRPNLVTLVEDFRNRLRRILMATYDRRRPYPACKPPLAAPIPGLPETAPPVPPAPGPGRRMP